MSGDSSFQGVGDAPGDGEVSTSACLGVATVDPRSTRRKDTEIRATHSSSRCGPETTAVV
ncbi:hypothetical protein RHCRD62_30210 [Rhodococcus sp. RD6.2]|nr:hypothetical protein RHCRD62_30210 [Rhodococcus sp. RD6.2]